MDKLLNLASCFDATTLEYTLDYQETSYVEDAKEMFDNFVEQNVELSEKSSIKLETIYDMDALEENEPSWHSVNISIKYSSLNESEAKLIYSFLLSL